MKTKRGILKVGLVFFAAFFAVVLFVGVRSPSFQVRHVLNAFYHEMYLGYVQTEERNLSKYIRDEHLSCKNLLARYHNLVLDRQIVKEYDLAWLNTEIEPYRIEIESISAQGDRASVRFAFAGTNDMAVYPPFLLPHYQYEAVLRNDPGDGWVIVELTNEFLQSQNADSSQVAIRSREDLLQTLKPQ